MAGRPRQFDTRAIIRLTDGEALALDTAATKAGKTRSDMIREAIAQWIKRHARERRTQAAQP